MTTTADYFDIHSLERGDCREYWINSAENHTEGAEIVSKALDLLKNYDAKTVSTRLFGSQSDIAEALRLIDAQTENITAPPICILQDDRPLNIAVHAISGLGVKPVFFEDELVGCEFEDTYAEYYMLNVAPNDKEASRYDQAKNIFEKSHAILQGVGCGFENTVRTWLFVQDILAWYDELNEARNKFFEHHDIYSKLVPASTGIGVANTYNKALVANTLAIKPKTGKTIARDANSPLQGEALDYKSSFSRAVKIVTPDSHRLYISGTASIDKAGNTIFVDDTSGQIEMTMQVVKAILSEAGMGWGDVAGSLVYFKCHKDFRLFDDYCRAAGIKLPHIKIHADICRDDLLFELELDAAMQSIIVA